MYSLSLSLSPPHTLSAALKSPLGTYYYTNGMTDSLKNVAGAEFHRAVNESGPYSEEILTSRGPLSEQVTVEVSSMQTSVCWSHIPNCSLRATH